MEAPGKEVTNRREDVIVLFDVDGTLTLPRQDITIEMEQFLNELSKRVTVGLVGGSDIDKIAQQTTLHNNRADAINSCINKYDYVFAENGLVAYKNGQILNKMSILDYLGEDKLQRFINFCLSYMSNLKLPSKRGNFIEFRNGLVNVCPVGRSCNQDERNRFAEFDKVHKIREHFVAALERQFGPDSEDHLGLVYVIGGQISFDAYPKGWDKTFCLKYLVDKYKKIYFFGDRTSSGGNDHEIYSDPRTISYTVTSPEHTRQLVSELNF